MESAVGLQQHHIWLHTCILAARQVLCRQVLDASFGEREKSTEKILGPAGIRTQDLLSTSQTLLPLSHWAHGRGAEARLHITAQARGLSRFQLSFSLSRLFAQWLSGKSV